MTRRNPWLGLSYDAWNFTMEASSVIVLRSMKLAAGGAAAQAEASRMVDEKIKAGIEYGAMAMTGGLGTTPEGAAARTLTHYRRKVRANRRRLSRT